MSGENEPSPSGENTYLQNEIGRERSRREGERERERERECVRVRKRGREPSVYILRLYLAWSMQIHELLDVLTSG